MSVTEPVYRWQAGHQIFSLLEDVPDMISYRQDFADNGDKCDSIQVKSNDPDDPIVSIPVYLTLFYADNDGDGFTISEGDCDDSDPNTYPGAPEICDGKENDCDGIEPPCPFINQIMPKLSLEGETAVLLWVDISSTQPIDKVWAIITPPDYMDANQSVIELSGTGGARYEGGYEGFAQVGVYYIKVYVLDNSGAISQPMGTAIFQHADNNSLEQANVITLDWWAEHHDFHAPGDQDWVKFYGLAGTTYVIEAGNVGEVCDPVIGIIYEDGNSVKPIQNHSTIGRDEKEEFHCQKEGIYYIKIYNDDPHVWGEGTGYDIKVYIQIAPQGDLIRIRGQVMEAISGIPIENAAIITSDGGTGLSSDKGLYSIGHIIEGDITMTAKATLYQDSNYFINEATLLSARDLIIDVDFDLMLISYEQSIPLCKGFNIVPIFLSWDSNVIDADTYNKQYLDSNCRSIRGYDHEIQKWYSYDPNLLDTSFPLENGRGYILYMNKQMDIFQEYCSIISHPLTSLVSGMNIITGANLVALFPDLELFNCTSYKLLNRGSLEGIQSISRYIMFRSRISPFPVQASSAYNIMVKVVDIFRNDTSHILGVKAE